MPLTPMMQQYLQIKEEHDDAIVFFRLGDFYEMFFDDAVMVSKELELTLTGKDCGLKERAPMCGVPFHSADTYIAKLIENGHKVAICEQLEDPSEAKGLVERGITRIITPGTLIEQNMMDEGQPNYIMCVYFRKKQAGCAFADVSTGEFCFFQLSNAATELIDELDRLAPREIISNDIMALGRQDNVLLSPYQDEYFDVKECSTAVEKHFGKKLTELGYDGKTLAVIASGALLKYLTQTQKNSLSHIIGAVSYESHKHLNIDRVARRNLELVEALRGGKKGTLLWLMDKAATAMGRRLIRSWIERPLGDKLLIEERLDAVEAFLNAPMILAELRHTLDGVYDIERLTSRIAYDAVSPKDCIALRNSLQVVPDIQKLIEKIPSHLIASAAEQINPMEDICSMLKAAILEDAPLVIKDGGIIKSGYNAELDQLNEISQNAKEYLASLEASEREKTGIKNLKIGYNRIFGYYIEVTKSFYELIPYNYIRKQTLANCERFITEELKQLESKILGANENALRLELKLFDDIRAELKAALPRLEKLTMGLKTIDAIMSFAIIAGDYGYVRPQLNEEGVYDIKDGRHPIVEAGIGRESFVPNDAKMDASSRIMIITGPNMAGKSTYMRQVALITIMAHIGSFVPASAANIAITDRVFTRIGASDDLYGGQSTFMVEMSELATILKYATPNSLVVLDEVGRGTSTFDGLSIAWAAVEYIAQKCGARAMFATHYHELSELEGTLEGVSNYCITAKEIGEDVIFLRKIVPGGADRSYGVAVARLAGLPRSLISRARQIMARLEVDDQARGTIGQSIINGKKARDRQLGFEDFKPMEFVNEIAGIDVVSMTPIEALNKLFELNEKAKRI